METGETIYVSTPNMEGLARIMYIEPGSIWPVQVEFEQPDHDGHRIYRVAYAEIQPAQDKRRYIARVSRPMRGYNLDDIYIISKPGNNGYFSVWHADKPHKGPIGSYITDFFEIIEPFAEIKRPMPLKTPQRAQIEPQPFQAPSTLPEVVAQDGEAENMPKIKIIGFTAKKPKPKQTIERKNKNVVEGQLSIFDFLGGV